jgi:hypothetical protein
MTTPLCGAVYTRPATTAGPHREVLTCQYLANHPVERHSWSTVKTTDEHETAAAAQRDHAVMSEKALLDNIESGYYDTILEAILNAGHNRKRTLRGVRGFPDLERRSDRRR